MRILVVMVAAVSLLVACVHRYSENPEDWTGPHHEGHFEDDFAVCRKRMDDKGFAYRADRRLILLDCMKKRGWHLKGAR